jgi:hypothetical protein
MSSRSVGKGLIWLSALAGAIPPAVVAVYAFVPAPFDFGILILGATCAGLLFAKRRPPPYVAFLAFTWSLLPLGFPYVDARIFETRVRNHLSQFQTAADLVLNGEVGPCWGPVRSDVDCNRSRFPPAPRAMTFGVFRANKTVTFTFKNGSRRSPRYAPHESRKPTAPCRAVTASWTICFS